LALEKLGAIFNQETKPLKYTPRKFVIHPDNGILYMIETEHLSYTEKTKQIRKHQMAQEMIESASESDKQLAAETAKAFLNEKLPENIFGTPKAAPGMWSSLIRIMDPLTLQTRNFFELEQNESAFSIALVRFASKPNQTFLLVGVAKDFILNPRSCGGGYIYTYQLFDNGDKLDFIHKTPIEEVPG
jgi:splicing factor 3B subunit 3